jgi:hypothetical protein
MASVALSRRVEKVVGYPPLPLLDAALAARVEALLPVEGDPFEDVAALMAA